MAKATLIVVGTSEDVQRHGTSVVGHIDVVRVLDGVGAKGRLVVLMPGPRATEGARSTTFGGFPNPGSGRHVFFLDRAEAGVGAMFRDAFRVEGGEGDQKLAALAAEIRLARIEDPDERGQETVRHLVAGLSAKGQWTRAHAARELLRVARVRRALVTPAIANQLDGLRATRQPRRVRAAFDALAQHLSVVPWRPDPGLAKAPRPPPVVPTPGRVPTWQRAFEHAPAAERPSLVRAALGTDRPDRAERAWWYHSQGDRTIRLLVLRWAGRSGDVAHVAPLRAAYPREEDPAAQAEIVAALGRLGRAADVGWIAARIANPATRRVAMIALARIRTAGALDVLQRLHAANVARDRPKALAEARWIAYLLSDAFVASLAKTAPGA